MNVRISEKDPSRRMIAFGDAHFPFVSKESVEALMALIKEWRPGCAVLLGDIIDFYQLSRFNKDAGRILKLQDDIAMTVDFLRSIREALGYECRVFYLEGNHEERLRKWLNNHPELASLESLSLPHLLKLEKLEIEFVNARDTLKIGDFVFVHGDFTRKWAGQSGKAHVERFLKSGVSGHSHRLNVFYWRGMENMFVWGEAGCLCDLNPEWTRSPDWHPGAVIGEYLKGGWVIQAVPFRGKLPVCLTSVGRAAE